MPCLSAGLVVGGVAPGLAHAVEVAGRGLATVAAIQSQAVQQQGDQGQQQFQRCTQCRREVALLLDLLPDLFEDLFEGLFDLDVPDLHGPGLSEVLARLYGHDRGGARPGELNHSFSVLTPAWFITCSCALRHPSSSSSQPLFLERRRVTLNS
jgi:hypothetical protein